MADRTCRTFTWKRDRGILSEVWLVSVCLIGFPPKPKIHSKYYLLLLFTIASHHCSLSLNCIASFILLSRHLFSISRSSTHEAPCASSNAPFLCDLSPGISYKGIAMLREVRMRSGAPSPRSLQPEIHHLVKRSTNNGHGYRGRTIKYHCLENAMLNLSQLVAEFQM